MAREKASAVLVFSGILTNVHRKKIVVLTVQYRTPSMHWNAAYVASGGLMSYGPNTLGMYKRSAAFVDKILKGMSPSVLPIEYPQQFELIINLKTAKELCFTLPKTFVEKADRLLE